MPRSPMQAGQLDVLETATRDGRTFFLARKCSEIRGALVVEYLVVDRGARAQRVAGWLSEAPARDYFHAVTHPVTV